MMPIRRAATNRRHAPWLLCLVCLVCLGAMPPSAMSAPTTGEAEAADAAAAAAAAPQAPSSAAPLASRVPFRDEAWIDSIRVSTGPDRDRDGFASGLEVSIDADTGGDEIQAFARLSLSGSDGVERILYDTGSIWLRGRSAQDRLEVELDLLDRFPADRYDLLIELRDVRRDALLDVVDRTVFTNLGGIALEDARRDGRIADDPPAGGHHGGHVTDGRTSSGYVAVDYAGAGGPVGLLGLIGLAVLHRRRALTGGRPAGRDLD